MPLDPNQSTALPNADLLKESQTPDNVAPAFVGPSTADFERVGAGAPNTGNPVLPSNSTGTDAHADALSRFAQFELPTANQTPQVNSTRDVPTAEVDTKGGKPVSFTALDNNQLDYLGQSGLARLGDASVNLVAKTAAYLGQSAGFIGGAPAAAVSGDISNMTDNWLVKASDALKNSVSDNFPIYKPTGFEQSSMWNKLNPFGTGGMSWWLDDGIDRLALTASMFVPGFAEERGIGLLGTTLDEAGQLQATGVVTKAISKVAQNPEDYGELGKWFNQKLMGVAADGTVDQGVNPAIRTYLQSMSNTEKYVWNMIGQSALNAKEAQESIKNTLNQQRNDGLNTLSDDDINSKAANGAAKAFWYTVPLTLAASAYELPQMYSTARTAESVLDRLFNPATGEALAATSGKSILKTVGKSLLTGLEHGQNESMQVAIGRYIEDSIAGNSKGVKDTRPTIPGIIGDFLDNINDPNGQNNIALGTIQGILTTFGGKAVAKYKGEDKAEANQLASTSDAINRATLARRYFNLDFVNRTADNKVDNDAQGNIKFDQSKLASAGLSMIGVQATINNRMEALQNNDHFALTQMNHNSIANMAYNFLGDRNGVQHLKGLLTTEAGNWKSNPDFKGDADASGNEMSVDQQLQRNLSLVDELKRVYDAVDQRHGGLQSIKFDKKSPEDIQRAGEFIQNLKFAQYEQGHTQLFYDKQIKRNEGQIAELKASIPNESLEELANEGIIKNPSNPLEEQANSLYETNGLLKAGLKVSKDTYKTLIDKQGIAAAFETHKTLSDLVRQKVDNPFTGESEPLYTNEKGEKVPLEVGRQYQNNSTTLNVEPEQNDGDYRKVRKLADTITAGTSTDTPEEKELQKNYPNLLQGYLANKDARNPSQIAGARAAISKELADLNTSKDETTKKLNEAIKQENQPEIDKLSKENESIDKQIKDKQLSLDSFDKQNIKNPELSTVKYLGSNPINQNIKVMDKNGDVRNLKPADLTGYQSIQSEEEKLANNPELLKWLDVQQKNNNSQQNYTQNDQDLNTLDREDEINNYQKAPISSFLSKEADYYDQNNPKDHQKRRLSFLTNLATFSPQLASKIKVLAITKSNEAAYGLNGLSDHLIKDAELTISQMPVEEKGYYLDDNNKLKPEHTPIAKIYTVKEADGVHISDANGKKIGKLTKSESTENTQKLIESGVFGVFGSDITGRYKFGPKKNQINYSGGTDEDVKELATKFKQWRDKISGYRDFSPEYSIQDVSRGIIQRDSENKPVTETALVDQSNLGKDGLITIPTGPDVTIGNTSYSFPVGQPLLTNGANIEFLNNRTFSETEAKSLTRVIRQYVAESGNIDKTSYNKLKNYLNGVVYLKSPGDGEQISPKQIFYDGAKLNFSSQFAVPFTEASILANESRIVDFLKNTYNNTNNSVLKENQPFNEIQVDKDGNVKEFLHKSYQHFLLSPKYDLNEYSKDKEEGTRTPYLQTRAKRSVASDDPLFLSRYTTLGGDEFTYTPKVPVEKTKEKAPTLADEDFLDFENVDVEHVTRPFAKSPVIEKEVKSIPKPDSVENIESKRKEELNIDGKLVYETGKDRNGIKYNSWIDHEEAVNAKYDKELKDLASSKEELPKEDTRKFKFKSPSAQNDIKKADDANDSIKENRSKFKGKDPSIGKEEFSLASKETFGYSPMDVSKEIADISRLTPFHTEILSEMIKTPEGLYAWGSYKNMAIKLYEAAPEGTGYHELFEGVYKAFTTLNEKKNLLREFQLRGGTFTHFDGNSYTDVKHSEATEFQMKEQLADEFGNYMLNDVLPPKANTSLIQRWFKNILNFIKSILSGSIQSVDDLFASIKQGEFKSAPYNSIDTTQEHKLADLNYQQIYELRQGTALQLVQDLLNPNGEHPVSLTEFEESPLSVAKYYQSVFDKFNTIYEQDVFSDKLGLSENMQSSYYNMWQNVKEDWAGVTELANQYLKTVGLTQKLADDNGVDELDRTKNENYNPVEYSDEDKYFKNDAKNTASRSIKLLFLTMPESKYTGDVDANGKIVTSNRSTATLLQQPIEYAKNFNSCLAQLLSLNSMSDKEAKLKELGESFPNFKRLYGRLMAVTNVDDNSSILNTWKLRTRFFKVMSKMSPDSFIQYVDKVSGNTFTGSSNLQNTKKIVSQGWLDGLKSLALTGNSKIAKVDGNGNFLINTSALNFNIEKQADKISFLNQLAIPFTNDMYNSLSKESKDKLNKGIAGFAYQLGKFKSFNLKDAKSLDASTNLENIAEAYVLAGNDFESTYTNINGDRRTQFPLTNAVSKDLNDINNSQTKEELFKTLPQLEQVKDSVYLNNILFDEKGDRKAFQMKIGYVEGSFDDNGKALPTENMAKFQRLSQEVNQNLNNRYYILVPADGKTQWLISMANTIGFKSVASGGAFDALNTNIINYYNTEKQDYQDLSISLSEDKLAKRANIFRELSNGYTSSPEELAASTTQFVKDRVNEQFRYLRDFGIIKSIDKGNYSWDGLDGDFTKKEGLDGKKLSPEEVRDILIFRNVNFMINNIETQKIFFGNILSYTDATKRYKSFLSPREVSIFGVPEFNDYLNDSQNNAFGITLPNALTGQYVYSDYIKTVTMADVNIFNKELAKISEDYKKVNTTDAQSYSTLPAFKERRLKDGTWTNDMEDTYQSIMASDRQAMLEDGYLNSSSYPKQLQEQDKTVMKNSADSTPSYMWVEKPIVTGFANNEGIYNPILDKDSIVSFSYNSIRNTNFRDHYIRMLKQGIGYLATESARKVGNTGTDSFYNEDGGSPDDSTPYQNVVNIPFSAFGNQVDTSSKKEKQTRGSQITKLAIVNLKDAGIPISKEAGRLADYNITLLKEQTNIGYQKFVKSIGAEDTGNGFQIKDKKKILDLVTNELYRREVGDNIRQMLQLNDNQDLVVPFEALPNYRQIKSILYSYVDKYITSPNMSGAPKVQVSGAMMEEYGVKRKMVNGKEVYYSDGLKFYEDEKGKRYCEVMIPCHFLDKLKAAGIEYTDEKDLMEKVLASPDANDILSGIGFRIPTQELNSIENFRIKSFLPAWMGDTVVVPEEITTKAGSDFDIDKLNTYLKNVYVDEKGVIRSVPYFGMGEDAKSKLREIALSKLLSKKVVPDEAAIDELNPEDFEDDSEETKVDKLYQQSIENEYFRNIKDIMELPENFKRLVTPNTTEDLKSIRDTLVGLAPNEFSNTSLKSIINPSYMLDVRHEGLSVKNLVGIAALAQTGSAIAQLSPIVIDKNRIKSLFTTEKAMMGNGEIALPHNQFEGNSTISSIKDVEGAYITDKISQYISGTVDVFKDAFLAQINFNARTAGTYLTLERLGVPNSIKHPIVSLFMNQPVIRKYLNMLDIEGIKSLTNRNIAVAVLKDFNNAGGVNFEEFPKNLDELTNLLKNNIQQYYSGEELSLNDKKKLDASQEFVLGEFMKYSVISSNLFRMQQGTNYDTASLNDNNALYFKEYQREQAISNNIFNSAEKYLGSTFIGDQREKLLSANSALSDVIKINQSPTKEYVSEILSRIAAKPISLDDKVRIAGKMEESLVNFLIQTKTSVETSLLNTFLLNKETAIVNQLREIKSKLKTDIELNKDSIAANPILKRLIPYIQAGKINGTKNITLAVKARDLFTKNLYSDAFQQLYNHPATQQLAKDVISLSFLQNGISNSPISFKDAIPANLYSDVVNDAIGNLQNEESLSNFVNSDTFYRNNWADESIVPQVDNYQFPLADINIAAKYINDLKKANLIDQKSIPPAAVWVDVYNPAMREKFITHNTFEENPEDPITKRFMKRVEDAEGNPIIRKIENVDGFGSTAKALFVQTNAWGDSFRAQEHYNEVGKGVFNNGYMKVGTEIDSADLANYITTGNIPDTYTDVESPTQEELKPEEGTEGICG